MFYTLHAIGVWVISYWLIDWRRLRELLVYGFVGSWIAATEDQIGQLTHWWLYRDLGWLDTHLEISLLISISAAPLMAMFFVQGLRDRRLPWLRMTLMITAAMIPEIVALYTGHILYANGWNLYWSVAAHLPVWLLLWALYLYLGAAPVP